MTMTTPPSPDLLTQRARHVRYPRTLQYFTFNTYFQNVRADYERTYRAQMGEALRAGMDNPRLPLALRERLRNEFDMADAFAAASIYYATRAITQTAIDAAQRIADRQAYQHLPIPEPPILPLWLEFAPDATLGDSHMAVRGLLFREIEGYTPVDPVTGAPINPTRENTNLSREDALRGTPTVRYLRDRGIEVTLLDDQAELKTFRYGVGEHGIWVLEQVGACDAAATCPIARRTRQGVLYGVHQTMDIDDAFPLNPVTGKHERACQCYDAGAGWAVILYALLNLLNAEGVAHTSVQHTARVEDHLPNHARRAAQTAAETWNGAFGRRYVELSISKRLHRVRVTRRAGDPAHARLVDDGVDNRDATRIAVGVPTHHRLLIPGPDKPWRGDRPRIIAVRSYHYERRARHEARSKTIRLVTP